MLSHCEGVARTSTEEKKSPHLGVLALEKDSLLLPHFSNGMHVISSPRMLYGSHEQQVNGRTNFFEYSSTGSRSHFSAADQKVSQAKSDIKKSGMLRDKGYTVESVSTNSIQMNKNDNVAAARTPTYTVVFLGELSVGKSALCKKFYKSGMNQPRNKMSAPKIFHPLDLTDDDDLSDVYSSDSLDQMKTVDSRKDNKFLWKSMKYVIVFICRSRIRKTCNSGWTLCEVTRTRYQFRGSKIQFPIVVLGTGYWLRITTQSRHTAKYRHNGDGAG